MLTEPNCNGYKRYINSTVGDTYEHRLVAEEIIKRKLKPGEVVHHKDENRSNNSHDNLMVFHTNADHNRYHRAEFSELEQLDDKSWICIRLEYSYICENCKKSFNTYEKDQPCCSYKCADLYRRKVQRPPKQLLHELVWSMPTTKVAKLYGVSDKAIHKWCISYEIDKPPRGYWAKQRALIV